MKHNHRIQFFRCPLEAALVKHRNDITNIFLCLYKHMETFTLMQNIKGLPNTTILIKNHSPAEIWAQPENEKVQFLYTGAWTTVWMLTWSIMYFSPFWHFWRFNSQSSTKSSGLSDAPAPGVLPVPQSPQEVRAPTLVLPGCPELLTVGSTLTQTVSEFLYVYRVIPQHKRMCVTTKAKELD